MYQQDVEYASRRLNDTLVRLVDGSPFHVLSTYLEPDGQLYHRGINLLRSVEENTLHTNLDLTPVPLGFVNMKSEMVFVCRKPMRRDWRQGLSRTSMLTYGNINARDLPWKVLVQPITNQYPSYAKALQGMDKKSSFAFSRDFGLTRIGHTIGLTFRQHLVGEVQGNQPILKQDKFFLQEHLNENMG